MTLIKNQNNAKNLIRNLNFIFVSYYLYNFQSCSRKHRTGPYDHPQKTGHLFGFASGVSRKRVMGTKHLHEYKHLAAF